jgi:small subunit ribosomal protein S13
MAESWSSAPRTHVTSNGRDRGGGNGVARIAGVDLPRDKRVDVGLRYIYGIGPTRARQIVAGVDLDGGRKIRDLTDEEVVKIREWIDRNYKVEGDLRRDVAQDIKRKIEIGSYQGIRHRRSLPVRGQRTHTNARTRKGPKKTVGVKRKKGK